MPMIIMEVQFILHHLFLICMSSLSGLVLRSFYILKAVSSLFKSRINFAVFAEGGISFLFRYRRMLIKHVDTLGINIIQYIFVYKKILLRFGEYLIHFFIVFIKYSLGSPHFTLFIRSFYISDDG